jgi:5'-methylthioadenosine phosphorylase
MAYALVAMVTDYDCWKEEEHVSVELVVQNLLANADNAKRLLAHVLPRLNNIPNDCADALKGAIFTHASAFNKATKKKLHPLIAKYVK